MITARYFDGRSADAHVVSVDISRDRVIVTGDGVFRDEALDGVVISERIGHTPRFVRFADGAFCEVNDVDALEVLLKSASVAPSQVSQWETSGRLVWTLVVAFLALGIAGYWIGLPIAARVLADRLPASALEGLSDQTLRLLDDGVFAPSELPVSRQQGLSARFALMAWPTSESIDMRILYRTSEDLGANAMALPSGAIIVTDDLVKLAKSDDEVLAVLAHEAGHVQERHGLRNIIQSSVVSLVVTWVVGDVGSLIAVAPTALMQLKYSRDLERDADSYAARALEANDMSLGLLADILERMEAAHGGSGRGVGGAVAYVSSHPATEERIANLRK
jgi:Zn-dependent protease with chaperone function